MPGSDRIYLALTSGNVRNLGRPDGNPGRRGEFLFFAFRRKTEYMSSAMTLVLRQLNESDEQAFFEGFKEWEGESPHWYTFAWQEGMSFLSMLDRLRKDVLGVDLAPGQVPHTMLYGFWDGKIIGRMSIRHHLNEYLRVRGGHIGYSVAKRYRGRGYATEMVRQALKYCEQIGIGSIMITCADDNIASWKIIEKFGGKLKDRIWDDEDEEYVRRYWIDK